MTCSSKDPRIAYSREQTSKMRLMKTGWFREDQCIVNSCKKDRSSLNQVLPSLISPSGTAAKEPPNQASKSNSQTIEKDPPKNKLVHSQVVAKVILLCGYPTDSTMVRYIDQQGLTELEHLTTIDVNEFKEFFTVDSFGNFEAKPLIKHLQVFEAFLLFYKRKRRESSSKTGNDIFFLMTKEEFH